MTDLEAVRKALGDPGSEVRLARSLDDLVHEADFELAESVLLGKLHRPRTLKELEGISTLEEGNFLRALYGLYLSRVATCSGAPPFAAEVAQDPTPAQTDSRPPSAAEPEIAAPPPRGADPVEPVPAPAGRPQGAVSPEAERVAILRLARTVTTQDHYQFLGLNSASSYQDVFDAWEKFDTRYHPDRASEPHLTDLRNELAAIRGRAEEAFDTLSSPQKRPLYDRISQTRKARAPATGETRAVAPGETSQIEARASLIRANLQRADELIRVGEVFPAIKLLEQVCVMEPTPAPLLKLARLMLINPQWANRALEKLRQALEIDPGFVDGWLEVAEFWRRRRHRERQRKALERAVAADPDHEIATEKYRELIGDAELKRLQVRARASGAVLRGR